MEQTEKQAYRKPEIIELSSVDTHGQKTGATMEDGMSGMGAS